jgi:Flp pilus assembly protein TadG
MRGLRTHLRRDGGALTLSYVMIVPVFLFGIMLVVQASVWYLARETALAAAQHGADVARTSTPPPGAGAQAALDFARSAAPGFLKDVSATARGSTPTTVKITVSGEVPLLVPGAVIKVTEVVTAPVERFVALGDRVSRRMGVFSTILQKTLPSEKTCRDQRTRCARYWMVSGVMDPGGAP